MISRYTRPEMGRLWEPENRYRIWLQIELLICEALSELGEIPREALETIRRKATFDAGRIEEIERVTRHDVVAFIQCVSEAIGEEARYLHMGVTSSDILDTSMAVCLRDAADLLIRDFEVLLDLLKEKAVAHRHTLMIGRTHGVHAEPITFGLKMLHWYSECQRNRERMQRAKRVISFGKISGAVGTYAHLSPAVERYVCERLGLEVEPISSQIVPRDRHAEYFSLLAVIASSMERFAMEIRHLQRTEVLEAEEPFGEGQKGSSAMPHKRNPVLSENLCGLARLIRSHAVAALENVPLWHERDISHSSVERVIAPDSTILLDYMIHRFTSLLGGLQVYPERMARNLQMTRGLIHSEAMMLKLIRKGLSRLRAYEIVQRIAMEVWRGGKGFRERIMEDPEIRALLGPKEIEESFDPRTSLAHLDEIYERVLGR